MAESPTTTQAEGQSSPKSAPVIINESTLENVDIPEIKAMLIERLSTDFGILDKLLACKALSRQDINSVKSKASSDEKNLHLLDLVKEKQKLREFFMVLKESHQEHLVNYVTAKGEYKPEYVGAWPLTNKMTEILDVNQESLVDLLDLSTNELVHKLFEFGFLNKRQREFLCKQQYDYNKATELLNMLHHASISDYNIMIYCLNITNQSHVASILQMDEVGVLVPLHNVLSGDPNVVTSEENEIVDRIENMLANLNIEDPRRIVGLLQLRLFRAQKGHSIVLYVWCKTLDELQSIHSRLNSGELQKRIEQFFNHLVVHSEKFDVTVNMSKEIYDRCKKFLEVDHSQERAIGIGILKMCQQLKVEKVQRIEEEEEKEPMDVEQIEQTVSEEPMEGILKSLCTVEESIAVAKTQRQMYETELEEEAKLQKAGRMEASAPWTESEKMATIISNNTDYFVEYIRPRGLVDRLRAQGCLTDEDTRYIKTLKENMDKNDEILKVIRGLGPEKYNVFIELLRSLNQSLVAEVAEKGGVVLKATISNEECQDLKGIEQQLVDRINQLLNKTGSRSMKLVHFLSLLGRGGIQLLNAKLDYDIIVWLWFRSKQSLVRIQSNEELTKLMTELFKALLDREERIPQITYIDLEDPHKLLVDRRFSISGQKVLPESNRSICAVSELNSNIYALCQKPSSILMFDLHDPSKQSSEIPLTNITDPVDIAASSSCLYITDRGSSTVWKFMPTDNSVTSWLHNISSPYTLSVTSDEGVIRVDQGQPSHLEIYNTGAKRIYRIELPANVKSPHHAVETAAGTYVISYGEEAGANGVCEITRDGNVISVFDTWLEVVEGIDSSVNNFLRTMFPVKKIASYCPRYLTVDEYGQVYATDPVKGGLMVFDPRLKLEEFIVEDMFREPAHVHCLKTARQFLLVCGREQRTIGMFFLKPT